MGRHRFANQAVICLFSFLWYMFLYFVRLARSCNFKKKCCLFQKKVVLTTALLELSPKEKAAISDEVLNFSKDLFLLSGAAANRQVVRWIPKARRRCVFTRPQTSAIYYLYWRNWRVFANEVLMLQKRKEIKLIMLVLRWTHKHSQYRLYSWFSLLVIIEVTVSQSRFVARDVYTGISNPMDSNPKINTFFEYLYSK